MPQGGLMHCHPTIYRKSFGIFLRRRGRGTLPHLDPGKSPEALEILQADLQVLVRQTPVLIQNGTPEDLVGAITPSRSVSTL